MYPVDNFKTCINICASMYKHMSKYMCKHVQTHVLTFLYMSKHVILNMSYISIHVHTCPNMSFLTYLNMSIHVQTCHS